jgi:hypothetical protein
MEKKTVYNLSLKYFFLFVLVFVSLQLFAEKYPEKETLNESKNLSATEWQLYKEYTGVQIYYRSLECHDVHNGIHQQVIILKFVNTTDTDLDLTWNAKLWFNGVCINCENTDDEHTFRLALKGGESLVGSCNSPSELQIFSKFLNHESKTQLTNFELADLSISPK